MLARCERQISESVDGLDPQHRAVRSRAARAQLRREVQIAVRALLHVADADAELIDAARAFETYLTAETLALSVAYDGTGADAVTIEGRPLHIAVSRA